MRLFGSIVPPVVTSTPIICSGPPPRYSCTVRRAILNVIIHWCSKSVKLAIVTIIRTQRALQVGEPDGVELAL